MYYIFSSTLWRLYCFVTCFFYLITCWPTFLETLDNCDNMLSAFLSWWTLFPVRGSQVIILSIYSSSENSYFLWDNHSERSMCYPYVGLQSANTYCMPALYQVTGWVQVIEKWTTGAGPALVEPSLWGRKQMNEQSIIGTTVWEVQSTEGTPTQGRCS